jgi:hypothetical protein
MRKCIILFLICLNYSCLKNENVTKLKCIADKLGLMEKSNSMNVFFVYSHNCELCTDRVIKRCSDIMKIYSKENFIFVFSSSDHLLYNQNKELFDFDRITVFSNKMDELESCGLIAVESIFVIFKNNKILKWEKL